MGFQDNVNVDVRGAAHIAPCTYKTVILKQNITKQNLNVLTQAMLDEYGKNTKFVIKWDYVLKDNTITIPQGCLIEFDGGSLSGGTISLNKTYIDAPATKIFDCNLIGSVSNSIIYAEWFGAIPDDDTVDNSNSIQSALNFIALHESTNSHNGPILQLSNGIYFVGTTIYLKKGTNIVGCGPSNTKIIAKSNFSQGAFVLDCEDYSDTPLNCIYVKDLTIHGNDIANGINAKGLNENSLLDNINIDRYYQYGLYVTRSTRAVTQNTQFNNIFITNTPNKDSYGVYLDYCFNCIFNCVTVDVGNNLELFNGTGIGLYINNVKDVIFNKLNLEDCIQPIFIGYTKAESIIINNLLVKNPIFPIEKPSGISNRAVIRGNSDYLSIQIRSYTYYSYYEVQDYDNVNYVFDAVLNSKTFVCLDNMNEGTPENPKMIRVCNYTFDYSYTKLEQAGIYISRRSITRADLLSNVSFVRLINGTFDLSGFGLPRLATNYDTGALKLAKADLVYDDAKNLVEFYNGATLVPLQVISYGTSVNRPVGEKIYVGFQYFDTTIGKPIWASAISGSTVTWVDATGTPV